MVAWRMVTRALGLVSTLVLARLLVPADFGLVAIATSFAAAIDSLSELGLQAALVRLADDDTRLYDTAFTIQAIRGLLTGLIVACGAWSASWWFGDDRLKPLLFILAAVAAVGGFDNIAVVRFQRDLRFDVEFRLLFVSRILQFLCATGAAFAFRSYWSLIIGIVVGRLSRTFMTYWVQPYRPRLSLSRWRDLAEFSFWSWASSMAYMVWYRCDAFVLGPAIGMAQLGVFLLSAEIGLLPASELVDPATRALYAGVAAARNRGTEPLGLALPLMAVLLMIVFPISLGISATSGYVVAALLGPSWAIGQPVIAIFALACAITPVTFVSATVLNASGRVRRNFWAVAASAGTRVLAVCAVAGYRRLDLAALAVFGVIAAEAGLFLFQLARTGRLDWLEVWPGVLRTLLPGLAVALVVSGTGLGWHAVSMAPFQALFIGGTIGLGCIIGCVGLQMALWTAVGRPGGPEATLVGIAGDLAIRLLRQKRITFE
nr:oligosaccharide flippase family protein [uncultured Rhodopila sp.]